MSFISFKLLLTRLKHLKMIVQNFYNSIHINEHSFAYGVGMLYIKNSKQKPFLLVFFSLERDSGVTSGIPFRCQRIGHRNKFF